MFGTRFIVLRPVTKFLIFIGKFIFHTRFSTHFTRFLTLTLNKMDFEREFPSRDALTDYVREFQESKGCFISVERSREGKIWLKCDMGGTYAQRDGDAQRHTGTRLIDCPAKFVARFFNKNRCLEDFIRQL